MKEVTAEGRDGTFRRNKGQEGREESGQEDHLKALDCTGNAPTDEGGRINSGLVSGIDIWYKFSKELGYAKVDTRL